LQSPLFKGALRRGIAAGKGASHKKGKVCGLAFLSFGVRKTSRARLFLPPGHAVQAEQASAEQQHGGGCGNFIHLRAFRQDHPKLGKLRVVIELE